MGDFAQNGSVATLHNFGTRTLEQVEDDLKLFAGYRPMELILPSLYSELEGPALKEIVKHLGQVKYLNHIIIGLDKADREQYKYAYSFFKDLNQPFSLLWNDGPRMTAISDMLEDKGLAPLEPGKGQNVCTDKPQ